MSSSIIRHHPDITTPRVVLAFCLFFALIAQVHADCAGLVMKADQVVLDIPGSPNNNTVTIPFQQTYDTPPLVFILPHDTNPDPVTVRIVNVTSSGFTVGLSEPPGDDGVVASEAIHYLAIEPGEYALSASMELKVGTANIQNFQTKNSGSSSYANVAYPNAFSVANPEPFTFSEVQTINNTPGFLFAPGTNQTPWFDSTTLNSTSSRSALRLALEIAESGDGSDVTVDETVAYLAITTGSTTFVDSSGTTITLTAHQTPDNVSGNCDANPHNNAGANTPIAIANKTNRDGGDGGWVRLCSIDNTTITLQVDEDRNNDAERNHTDERIDVLSFSQAFTLKDSPSLPDMEAGEVTVTPPNITALISFTPVMFSTPFVSPPNVFVMPTDEEAEPASVRIRNVTTSGFEIAQFKPEGEAGAASSMTIDYFAIVDGVTRMPDNALVFEVGNIQTANQQGSNVASSGPSSIVFSETYAAAPAFIIDVQTTASEPSIDPSTVSVPWLETYVGGVSPTGADIALERAKTSSGAVQPEKLSYLATQTNQSAQFTANGGAQVTFKSLTSPTEINGWDDVYPTCESYTYPGGAFSQTPLSVGNMVTRAGGDGGWLRKCAVNSNQSQIALVIDEDESNSTNRSHGANESASVIAFSQAFEWCPPQLALAKTTAILQDPINGTTNAKHIPGAHVQYALRAQNLGRVPVDAGSVVISDTVPTQSVLYLGTDPALMFAMSDGSGANASGLTPLVYSGPASLTDDVSFSNDGGFTWTHIPTVDADGFDSSDTTHFRLNPKGSFSGGSATATPEFSITFTTKITP